MKRSNPSRFRGLRVCVAVKMIGTASNYGQGNLGCIRSSHKVIFEWRRRHYPLPIAIAIASFMANCVLAPRTHTHIHIHTHTHPHPSNAEEVSQRQLNKWPKQTMAMIETSL